MISGCSADYVFIMLFFQLLDICGTVSFFSDLSPFPIIVYMCMYLCVCMIYEMHEQLKQPSGFSL